MAIPAWNWVPQVISHVFWYRKKAFQLKEDTYADWVLFAVQAGSFRYRIGEASGEAGFGDAVLCPPGMAFQREVLEPVTFHFYTIAWHVLPVEGGLPPSVPVRAESGDALPSNAAVPADISLTDVSPPDGVQAAVGVPPISCPPCPGLPVHFTWRDHNRLSSTYFYMEQLARLRSEEPSPVQWNHFLQDLWQLYWMEQEVSRQAEERRGQDPLMQEAERWLRQQAFGPIVLKEFGERLGLSPVQLTRKFQGAYGVTPMDYLTSLRIQKAKTLLLETEMTLEQIAEQCGYENGFYLSRMFSKTVKTSPSQYRKAHRV